VIVRLWGTRGSVASPGPETLRYGGNTACVEVRATDAILVLDAGTGIRRLGATLQDHVGRVDLLLSHLHMDHLQGIGFFAPIFRPDIELHIWGPPSTTLSLRERLMRYLSPPLFPVRLRDLGSRVSLHDVPAEPFTVGSLTITGQPVIHPGPSVGYRISSKDGSVAYLPDHEPALGLADFPLSPAWTSGSELAAGADLLIHDVQYTEEEYPAHVGWGHSSVEQAWAFAVQSRVRRLVTFHHDPSHADDQLDEIVRDLQRRTGPEVIGGVEGLELQLG